MTSSWFAASLACTSRSNGTGQDRQPQAANRADWHCCAPGDAARRPVSRPAPGRRMIKGPEAVPTLAPARTPPCPASSSELPAFSTSVPSVPAPGRCTGGRDDEHNAVAAKKGQVQMAGNEPVDTSCNYDRQQEAGCVQEGELPARNLIQPLVHGPPSFQREDRREPPPGQRI